jgi:uncharacterized protein YeaO (DUF488 family)
MGVRKPLVMVARVYEATAGDSIRVLVDRVWPRGVSKARDDLAEWCKDVAPSTELRRWYGHDPQRFEEFARRYRDELARPEPRAALDHLRQLARQQPVVLVTATKQVELSQAAVLADLIAS